MNANRLLDAANLASVYQKLLLKYRPSYTIAFGHKSSDNARVIFEFKSEFAHLNNFNHPPQILMILEHNGDGAHELDPCFNGHEACLDDSLGGSNSAEGEEPLGSRKELIAKFVPTSEYPSDEWLIAGVKSFDETAFELLREKYAKLLMNISMYVLRNHMDAQETVADIWVQVLQSLNHYNPAKGPFIAWLIVVARRRAVDKSRRRHSYFQALERKKEDRGHEIEVAQSNGSPYDTIVNQDDHAMIIESLETLPIAQREVVELFMQGYSQREISNELNVPLGTVKTRMELGLAKLRSRFQRKYRVGVNKTSVQETPTHKKRVWPKRQVSHGYLNFDDNYKLRGKINEKSNHNGANGTNGHTAPPASPWWRSNRRDAMLDAPRDKVKEKRVKVPREKKVKIPREKKEKIPKEHQPKTIRVPKVKAAKTNKLKFAPPVESQWELDVGNDACSQPDVLPLLLRTEFVELLKTSIGQDDFIAETPDQFKLQHEFGLAFNRLVAELENRPRIRLPGRGRPRKTHTNRSEAAQKDGPTNLIKRRGRPPKIRKIELEVNDAVENNTATDDTVAIEETQLQTESFGEFVVVPQNSKWFKKLRALQRRQKRS